MPHEKNSAEQHSPVHNQAAHNAQHHTPSHPHQQPAGRPQLRQLPMSIWLIIGLLAGLFLATFVVVCLSLMGILHLSPGDNVNSLPLQRNMMTARQNYNFPALDSQFQQMNTPFRQMQRNINDMQRLDNQLFNGLDQMPADSAITYRSNFSATDNQSQGNFSFILNGKNYQIGYTVKDSTLKMQLTDLKQALTDNTGSQVDLKILDSKGNAIKEFKQAADLPTDEISQTLSKDEKYTLELTIQDRDGKEVVHLLQSM